jgi:hypothetical protein
MRKLHLSLALVALCLLAVACTDDDPVKPAEFAVIIHVTDPAGNPVEDLRVGMVNDNPFLPDGFSGATAAMELPYSAAVVVSFSADVVARARMTIEDIEGRVIRVGFEKDILPGTHSWNWDGRNDAGDLQPSGRYTAHLVTMEFDTGEMMFEDRTDMLLAMLDPSRVPVGFTGLDGKLVIKDMKLFPHLYDRPDMTATNENAEPLGEFSPASLMRISLADTNGGGHMHFMMEIPGATTLNLVWDPRMAVSDWSPDPEERLFPGVALIDTTLPVYFELRPVYPNPFN